MDINVLYDKDDKVAYAAFLKMESSAISDSKYYDYLDDYFSMLMDSKAYVRVRGFRMICAVSKWDDACVIDKRIDQMLIMLSDPKPTAVRQCLAVLPTLLSNKPYLTEAVYSAVQGMDLSIYKDSMAPLIKKDSERILGNT